MYNKALSKKIITVLILAIMTVSILVILMVYSILKNVKLEQNTIKLDDAHVTALTEAGFIQTDNGFIKEDISMSFQIYTKGTKEHSYPHVLMLFAGMSEDVKTEKLVYDALDKVYYYQITDSKDKTSEIVLDKNLNFLNSEAGEKENSGKEEELKAMAIDKLEKFYVTFGLSAENTLGFDCPEIILQNAAQNTSFGMQAIKKVCTESEGAYTYTSEDGKLQIKIYPNGGESYTQPYLNITDKTLNVNSTIVPEMNTIVCSYSQDDTFINAAYDLSEDMIILYKEGAVNKTEIFADDAVAKSKIKEIFEKESKNIQTIFSMSPDMLLMQNKPFVFEDKQDETTEEKSDTGNENNTDANTEHKAK